MTAERGISAIRDEKCPFCALPVTYSVLGNRIGVSVSCPCCGTYKLSAEAETALPHWSYPDENWAAASYQIRRIADRDGPLLTQEALREILNHSTLPGPSEALDGIVIWLATNSRWPGNYVEMRDPFQRAIFGAFNASAFEAMQDWLLATGWVSGEVMNPMDGPGMNALLTPAGWERYRYLRTSGIGSRKAFMAMPFGFEDLNSVVSECFVPAVKQAGFDLQRVIDGQGAGLIDDQMRVRIRTSRFVICDLTHGNSGAYWEAGLAEGLGKPVIYTCREDVFHHADLKKRPHFDTGHLATVPWDPTNLSDAASRLKAMIRATLPGEAELED